MNGKTHTVKQGEAFKVELKAFRNNLYSKACLAKPKRHVATKLDFKAKTVTFRFYVKESSNAVHESKAKARPSRSRSKKQPAAS
jgi:hypothetical protein